MKSLDRKYSLEPCPMLENLENKNKLTFLIVKNRPHVHYSVYYYNSDWPMKWKMQRQDNLLSSIHVLRPEAKPRKVVRERGKRNVVVCLGAVALLLLRTRRLLDPSWEKWLSLSSFSPLSLLCRSPHLPPLTPPISGRLVYYTFFSGRPSI